MIRGTLKSRGKAIGTLLILALFIIAARSFDLQNQLRSLLRWIESLGNRGPLMFILIYILACVLFLPGSLLTLGAGVLFGVMRGAVIVSIASTLGATAAFYPLPTPPSWGEGIHQRHAGVKMGLRLGNCLHQLMFYAN